MKTFKSGDRVKVLKYNGSTIDFEATLRPFNKNLFELVESTNNRFNHELVFHSDLKEFGENEVDYYIYVDK